MSEEFVRRDVYDTEIRRIDREMEDLLGKIQSLEGRHFNLSCNVALIAAIFFITASLLSISIRFMR